ncbi:MAG: hypothetical protein ACKOJF_19540, partial [Planctomycetaceae bacterium]
WRHGVWRWWENGVWSGERRTVLAVTPSCSRGSDGFSQTAEKDYMRGVSGSLDYEGCGTCTET